MDFSCEHLFVPFTPDCDFENDLCGWKNARYNTINWSRRRLRTHTNEKGWFSQHFLCFILYFFAGYMSSFSNLFHSLVGLKNAKERNRRDYLLGLISLYLEIRGYHDSAHRAILRTSRIQSPRRFLSQFLTDNCQTKIVGGLRSRLICRIDVRLLVKY